LEKPTTFRIGYVKIVIKTDAMKNVSYPEGWGQCFVLLGVH
jgi:hypothetical protein